MIHDFEQKLSFSLGKKEQIDIEMLKKSIYGCTQVIKTDAETDKTGIDYIATLRRGATINIDAKARAKGASKYWKHGEPELALETWNVVPMENLDGVVGWTLNEASNADMILYTFDQSDTNKFYLLPFQHLRMSFVTNYNDWKQKYKLFRENSKRGNNYWKSEAIFVPASIVLNAITNEMNKSL